MPRIALIWYAMDQSWPTPDAGDPQPARFANFTAWVGRILRRKPQILDG
jgi:hypothetical protein